MIREIVKYFQLSEILDNFESVEIHSLEKQADSDNPAQRIPEDDERMRRMMEDMQRAEVEAMRLFNLQRALIEAEERALQMQRLQEELRMETGNEIENIRGTLNRVSAKFAQIPDPQVATLSRDSTLNYAGAVDGYLKDVLSVLPSLRQRIFDDSASSLLSDAEHLVEMMQARLFNLIKRLIEVSRNSEIGGIVERLEKRTDNLSLTDEQYLLLIGYANVRLARPLIEDANDAIEDLRTSATVAWTRIMEVCGASSVRSQFDRARRRARRAVGDMRDNLAAAMTAIRRAQNAIEEIEPAFLRNELPQLTAINEIEIPEDSDIPQSMGDSCAVAQIMDLSLDSNQDGSLFFIGATQETQDEAISMIMRAWSDISHYRGLMESVQADILAGCDQRDGSDENEEALRGATVWADIALEGAVRAVESARSAALRVPASRLSELRLYIPSQSDIEDIIDISRSIEQNHLCGRPSEDNGFVTRTFEYSGEFEDAITPANRQQLTEAVRTAAAGACVEIFNSLIRDGSAIPENFYFSVTLKLTMEDGHITQVATRTDTGAENEGRVNDFILREIANSISGQISPPLGIGEISVNLSIDAVDMGSAEGGENMAVQVLVFE